MFKNSFAFWSSIALIFCVTDVSCQRRKCFGTSRYCSGQHGKMMSVCRAGYCVCTGQHYAYDTCLPDAYGCRITMNSNTALAKPQYNKQPATTTYSCVPSNSSTQYEVHVLSVYEGNRHTRPPSAGNTNVNIISGGRSGKPVILVLASYEPVNWILNLPAGITISRVILVAYYVDESSVTGDVSQVQVVRRRGTRDSRWRRGYGNDLGGGDTVGLLQRVYNRFGVVTSFTGTYKADEWSLTLSFPQGSRPGFFSNGFLGSLATTATSSSQPAGIHSFISKATATHTAISTSISKTTSTSTSRLISRPTKTPKLRFERPIIKAPAPKAGGGAISAATSSPTTTPPSTPTSIPTSIWTSTNTLTTTTTTTPTRMLTSIFKPTSTTPTTKSTSRATHTSTHMPTSTSTPADVSVLTLEHHRQRCYTFSNHSSHCLGQYGKMESACRDGYCVCTGQDYDYSTCLPNAYGCRIQVNTETALAKPSYNNRQPQTIYSCTPADSSPQYEVHVLSVYEVINRGPPSAGDVTVNIVSRGRSDRRIILVLGSYEPLSWILSLPSGITISKVIVVAYDLDGSSVGGDVKQVEEVEKQGTRNLQWSVGYGSDLRGGDTVRLLRQVYNRFGVVASFTGTYRADEWSLMLSSPHEQTSPPFHVAATSVGPTENDNPKPKPWIFAVYTFAVVLLTALITVLFIRCRQRKSRREAIRSTVAEEAAHYNYIFDEVKGNSSNQTETTTHYVVRTLPPCPRYQSVDPSTKEAVKYERRNSEIHIYEELDFRRLGEGQDYENLRRIRVDVDYLELVDDPRLPTGTTVSHVCNNPDGGNWKVDVDGYLEPVDAAKDLSNAKTTYDCKVDHQYFELELVSSTDLHCGD